MPYGNPNFMNQLYRQKENIENMINQYTAPQAPVQNIINTSGNSDIDLKILKNNEDISNILVTKKTIFIDENNCKIAIKETDGTLSKVYDIIIPKDEKDIRIEELENKVRELEERVNDQSTRTAITSNDVKSATTSATKSAKPATITGF